MDLCGSWPLLPLAHVCVTLSVERPDTTSCEVEEGGWGEGDCAVMSVTGKGRGQDQD